MFPFKKFNKILEEQHIPQWLQKDTRIWARTATVILLLFLKIVNESRQEATI